MEHWQFEEEFDQERERSYCFFEEDFFIVIGEISYMGIMRCLVLIGDCMISEYLLDGFSCLTINKEGFFFETGVRKEETVKGYEA